jgi:hypothetical protein
VYEVVLLSLDEPAGGCGGSCGSCGEADTCATPRTPVLHAMDALTSAGARPTAVVAHDDREVDAALAQLDDPKTRLVVVPASDSQLRHVMRRLVRRLAPAPSKRPVDLAPNRTIPDLPAVGVLPLYDNGLTARLGLPCDPASVADAVLGDRTRALDLLRHDGGSVVLDGTLLGAADEYGQPVPWRARVEVDDLVLTDGEDQLLACAVANFDGYADFGPYPLVVNPSPVDGLIEVGIAVAVTPSKLEVRRARGRAVSVLPRDEEIPFVEDAVTGTLTHKRSWWTEPSAWWLYY